MTLQEIIHRYKERFIAQYGHTLTADQWSALNAIDGCRQGPYGEVDWQCGGCHHQQSTRNSCGHRSCNQCQNTSTQQWLARQEQKLLPVTYFMVTFTLPNQLRPLAKSKPQLVYSVLMAVAADTLKTFARNDATLNGDLGFCSVLHTHTRRLDYHPHVHVVVPGGAINAHRREWRKTRGKYLFNGHSLAQVFRGKFLKALADAGLQPPRTPKQWVVQCKKVGRGRTALRYLSRYLYRGVISNNNILDDDGTDITYQYRESETHQIKTRKVSAETFIYLVLQHTLPKGFRRARDYGFLHGNAKHTLRIVQWALRSPLPNGEAKKPSARPSCPKCQSAMRFMMFRSARPAPG